MNENKIEAGTVDANFETLSAMLSAFGFTQTGSATCQRTGLYARRSESHNERYLGALSDPAIAQGWVNEWFERHGPNLPE
jgi:hypothetical protein